MGHGLVLWLVEQCAFADGILRTISHDQVYQSMSPAAGAGTPRYTVRHPRVVAGDSFASAAPVRLFGFTSQGTPLRQRYAVLRDGRFLLLRVKESSETVPITIVLNWKPKPE